MDAAWLPGSLLWVLSPTGHLGWVGPPAEWYLVLGNLSPICFPLAWRLVPGSVAPCPRPS